MRIAVASEGNSVASHFGHCEKFVVFDIVNGAVIGKKLFLTRGMNRVCFRVSWLRKESTS